MAIESSDVVLTQDVGQVRIITMNRPHRLNAFNLDMITTLSRAVEEAAEDENVAVVLLTGAGRAFSSGADLAGMGERPLQTGGDAPTAAESFDRLQIALEGFRKPLVAAVNGLGVGFGFTVLGYCDFCFVARRARLRTPFSQLGLSPEASSSYLFPLRMGWVAAARALMLGNWFDAAELVEAGLALEVVEDDALMNVATAFAERIAENPLQSLIATKSLMLQAHMPRIQEARKREAISLSNLLRTPANKAALKAFAQRSRKSAG
jgi:enoyl-CoA hydratase/carnithine racemase